MYILSLYIHSSFLSLSLFDCPVEFAAELFLSVESKKQVVESKVRILMHLAFALSWAELLIYNSMPDVHFSILYAAKCLYLI